MLYAMLIYQDEAAAKAASEAEMEESVALFEVFQDKMAEAGYVQGGQRLRHTDTATSVRVRDGKTLVTDGPYAETKEQLGGFYLMECADLDQAIEVAAQIPTAVSGVVEVRPVFTNPFGPQGRAS
jgi:hypothetical protein